MQKKTTQWDPKSIRPTNPTTQAAVAGLRERRKQRGDTPEVVGGDWGAAYGSWSPPEVK